MEGKTKLLNKKAVQLQKETRNFKERHVVLKSSKEYHRQRKSKKDKVIMEIICVLLELVKTSLEKLWTTRKQGKPTGKLFTRNK